MSDPTVVSLCRQYLETWDADLLPLLCDRLEEIGWPGDESFENLDYLRRWFFSCPIEKYVNTVPAILRQYGGDHAT